MVYAGAQETIVIPPAEASCEVVRSVTEIRDGSGEPFGLERLCAELERVHAKPAQGIGTWGNDDDDVSLLVFRYEG